jgi:hypothetical protein
MTRFKLKPTLFPNVFSLLESELVSGSVYCLIASIHHANKPDSWSKVHREVLLYL